MKALLSALAIAAVLLAATPGSSQQTEVTITFSGVTVRGFMGVFDTPAIAHLDVPSRRPADPSDAGVQAAELGPPGDMLRGAPTQPMAFAPGHGTANPSFVQAGFLVEAFWAARTGTPLGYFKHAHFHPPDLSSGFEGQHFGNPNELHGLYIRSLDGRPFGVKSLRYRATRNRELPNKPFSINGFRSFSVNVLLSRSFDPRLTVRPQFAAFPIGLPVGNDETLSWWTLPVTGFEFVEQVYIASSASVDFDDIVLTRFGGGGEPSPAGTQ